MEAKVYSIDGKEVKTIEMSDDIFGCDVNQDLIYYAVNSENNNKRIGTASTKTRKDVKGSTKKPWRQKGTGRARAGDKKSPVWVGGGTVFGPSPRSYKTRLPKKMKRGAMKSLLSLKAGDVENFKVLEDFSVESGKTRDLHGILKNFVETKQKTIFVTTEDDKMLKRAGKNIPWLQLLNYKRLNAHDLFYCKRVVIHEGAVSKLNEFYAER